jgi:dihydroorotase
VGPPSHRPGPPSPDRRRLLLALGFGALNAAALSQLGGRPALSGGLATGTGGGDGDGVAAAATDSGPDEPPALSDAGPEPAPDHVFQTVIAGGRVIDPASRFDRVAYVGIDGDRIAAVSTEPLRGTTTIDADGLVVSPGFIDILSYEPNGYGIWFKVADGVTTNLGMHGINARATDFLSRFGAEGSPCHYGGAWDGAFHRAQVAGLDPGEAASPEQIEQLAADCAQQLAEGWIGVDLEPEYTPGAEYAELRRMAEVAAQAGVAVYVHGRYSDNTEPGTNADTLQEILQLARDTGCGVHVEHLVSTGGTFSMQRSLDTLTAAREVEGLDVSACMYPYDFWATYLASPRFNDGWQERFRISYDDLVVAGTGERVTEATFASLQEQNVLVAAYGIPDDDVTTCLQGPFVMIGSDAILEEDNNNHPRATGCFTRVLGKYVREERTIGLVDALAKMTILPARRLEAAAPAMLRKGRLQRGADADIVVFDPATVTDRSTVRDPAQKAEGIEWVLVSGEVVQSAGRQQHTDVRPGRPITRSA